MILPFERNSVGAPIRHADHLPGPAAANLVFEHFAGKAAGFVLGRSRSDHESKRQHKVTKKSHDVVPLK